MQIKVKGQYTIEVIQEDGSLKQGSGLNVPFDNLLTDMFYASITENTYNANANSISVGTGSTPPVGSNTALQAQIASAGLSVSNVYTPALLQGKQTGTATFATGGVIGNISEVGMFDYNGRMYSRALIKDANGGPTTITLTATDKLRVTYTIVTYLLNTTLSGTVTVTRDGVNESYPWVFYPAGMSASYGPEPIFSFFNHSWGPVFTIGYTSAAPAINTHLLYPTLGVSQAAGIQTQSYNGATKTKSITVLWGVGTDFPSGVNIYRPFSSTQGSFGYFYFPTPIPKPATQSISLTFTYSFTS